MRRVSLPDTFVGGTTFNVETGDNVTLYLRGPGSMDLQSSSGSISVPASTTATWPAGSYAYSLRKTDTSGNISEIGSGTIRILADIASLPAGTDTRSQNRKIYDAICAVIGRRASLDQESYRINNRELKRTPLGDLLKFKSRYAALVRNESGRGGFREHRVIF